MAHRPPRGARFDTPSHLLAPAGAWRRTLRGWRTERLDEYRVLRRPARYHAAYRVTLPRAVTRIHDAGGYLELCRADGTPVLRFHAAVARGARGGERQGTLAVAGLARRGWTTVHGHLVVRTALETLGLATPVVVDPGWSSTGTMAMARSHHTATLLPTGKVLVAGGFDANALTSAELYDPATGTWAATAPMGATRYQHTATLLPTGEVLVAGGGPRSAELYDPTTGTWHWSTKMTAVRFGHTATLMNTGQVLIAGGFDPGASGGTAYLSSSEIYDPLTDTFTANYGLGAPRYNHTATLLSNGDVVVLGGSDGTSVLDTALLWRPSSGPGWHSLGTRLVTARAGHTATLTPWGQILVAGGRDATGAPLASAELCSAVGLACTPTASMATAREGHTATLTLSGAVVVAGGKSAAASTSTEVYQSGSWTSGGALATARSGHTATELPSGGVLLTGGTGGTRALRSAERLEPSGASMHYVAMMAQERQDAVAVLLPSGKVLVSGGTTAAGVALDSAELYDPANGTWSPAGTMTSARTGHTETLLPSGKVLVAGGEPAVNAPLASAELYDPATRTWSATGSMIVPHSGHTATLLRDGEVLVTGVDSIGSNLVEAELYDPVSGTWRKTGSTAEPHAFATATLLFSGKVLLVGGLADGTAELYDPATGTWSKTGALLTPRIRQTATLLQDGRVLVVGGYGNGQNLASCEIYDPATGLFSQVNSLPLGHWRADHTAVRLPSGRVLVVGGDVAGTYTVYDPVSGTWSAPGALGQPVSGLPGTVLGSGKALVGTVLYTDAGVQDAWRPTVGSQPLTAGSLVTLNGTGFRGISEASGGGTNASATNFPLVIFRRIGGGVLRFVPADQVEQTSARITVPADFPPGYYRVMISANGITGGSVDLVRSGAAPIAADQSVSTGPGQAVGVTLKATDADGDALSYRVLTQPAHGTLSGTPPSLTYTPAAGFTGADGFTFRADDRVHDSNTATVAISVQDTAPIASDRTAVTLHGHPVAILLVGSDPDHQPVTFTVQSQPAHGTLSGTAPGLTYTPEATFAGTDTFSYQVSDGVLDSNVATVTIRVTDAAPVATGATYAAAVGTSISMHLSATDADGDTLTYALSSLPAHGTLTGTLPNLTYAPVPGYAGSDGFTFTASDGVLPSNAARVSLTLTPSPPTTHDQALSTPEDTPVVITLAGSDPDGRPLTYAVTRQPAHGALSGTAPTLTYTPAAGFTGSDSLVFSVSDGMLSAAGTVTIQVTSASGGGGQTHSGPGCGGCASGGGSPASLSGLLLGLVALGWGRRRLPGPSAVDSRGMGTESKGDLVCLTLTGHLTVEALTESLGPVEAQLPAGGPAPLIVDATQMTGYAAEARNLFVRRILSLRPRLGRIAIITGNPLWHMVIATMRLSTGTEMRAFHELADGRAWAGETPAP